MSIARLMQMAASGVGGDYEISRSLRFNSADSAYLSRTPASAGSGTTWTWNFWVKRSKLGGTQQVILRTASAPFTYIYFDTNDTLGFTGAAGISYGLVTSQVFRDVSSWYMLTFVADTTSATSTLTGSATDRLRLYVNGVQVSAFSATAVPTQNLDTLVNGVRAHYFGGNVPSNNLYCDFYVADFHAVDGQALTPSSFGETNATTGVWSPIAYSGSYGTNGFKLNFSDNSNTTAATLGADSSGNGNNWTPNNFSVAAGAGNDSLVDSPTQSGTDTGSGGEVIGNYATWNALDNNAITLANGNLDGSSSANSWKTVRATLGMSSGKWYWEFTSTASDLTDNFWFAGIANSAAVLTTHIGGNTNGWGFYSLNGNKIYNNTQTAYGNSWQTNDVIGVAFDADAGKIWFSKNGTWQASGDPAAGTNEAYSSIPAGTYFPAISPYSGDGSATSGVANFGARPFSSTAPSGFKALVTTNLPDPTILQGDDNFNTVLYTGNGTTQSITGVGFQPDFVWIKERSGAADHGLYDAVRGVTKQLESNTTTAETTEATGLTAFGTDGFTVGALAQLNTNTDTYVAWNWKAGGAGSSNTDGTITSTVSANTTAGISIVRWDGNGAGAAATIGHGLGAVPKMIINKGLDFASAWSVYHASAGNTGRLTLNTTDVFDTNSGFWNNTTPTSSVFTVGNIINQATPYDYVAYCFAEVEGFSKFGSYVGNNNADGPFIYTGFRPRWIMIKWTNYAEWWWLFDTARDTYNASGLYLGAQLSNAEVDYRNTYPLDILSNGFKIRNASYPNSTYTAIYAAFAENPFKNALAR